MAKTVECLNKTLYCITYGTQIKVHSAGVNCTSFSKKFINSIDYCYTSTS
uniref:Uncharacterized protein n=1 Tax=Octopus bimaculoides TaxID=37653 RepID=A0A0L8HKT0_OCTBM